VPVVGASSLSKSQGSSRQTTECLVKEELIKNLDYIKLVILDILVKLQKLVEDFLVPGLYDDQDLRVFDMMKRKHL
jgi:hypothetical protein